MSYESKFDSSLLKIVEGENIDEGIGDISPVARKTFADYLSRRTKAIEEPTTFQEKTQLGAPGIKDIYSYTPPTPNAYHIASGDDDDKHQKKFAKKFETARWTHPGDSGVGASALLLKNRINAENRSEDNRRNVGNLLKNIMTVGDLIPEPIGLVYGGVEAAKTGDNSELLPSPFDPWPNPLSLAVQGEIQVRLSKNRFSRVVEPIEIPINDDDRKHDRATYVSRPKAYKGLSQLSISARNAFQDVPVIISPEFRNARAKWSNAQGNPSFVNFTNEIKTTAAISKEQAKEIEKKLESQYVPFYLQDLRTDQILNFHAFLESVSDQYSPEWKDESGFGRLDNVHIYKGTTRTIGVEFYVVSTSEKDFDQVWSTINRLVMMVYPQWSEGYMMSGSFSSAGDKSVVNEGYNFIQPFSQVFSSSPIVRLRVGDIIASNYSTFNLARNFGIGQASTFFTNFTDVSATYFRQSKGEDQLSSFIKDLDGGGVKDAFDSISVVFANTVTLKSFDNTISDIVGLVDHRPEKIKEGYEKSLLEKKGTITILRGTSGEVICGQKQKDGSKIVTVKFASGSAPHLKHEITEVNVNVEHLYYNQTSPTRVDEFAEIKELEKLRDEQQKEIENLQKLQRNIEQQQVDQFDLVAKPSRELTKQEITKRQETYETLKQRHDAAVDEKQKRDSQFKKSRELINNEFIKKDTKNSIVRSFENNAGRGLAGTIRALSFDWNSAPWETTQGSRAPIWCKVNMQFNVIHDIPMGLNENGDPTSVPYPVGRHVREQFFPDRFEEDKEILNGQTGEYSKWNQNKRKNAWGEIKEEFGDEWNEYLERFKTRGLI